ncbi:hypothetical protein GP475_08685 [Corynebacterium poyangense]|uniref:Uncharacterized protein n=1 Tax=Corynebacterium poyangense TaxID=2684405 RepID=A0A7H0SQ79_9CORY|nr:hypothetical protein [Corynebacterium poyangense]QNQ90704.1 hypothetical protein GP475_08685 [Corynebacterium poyangense]
MEIITKPEKDPETGWWQWKVGETTYRTDTRGQGLWEWIADPEIVEVYSGPTPMIWRQIRGTGQFALPNRDKHQSVVMRWLGDTRGWREYAARKHLRPDDVIGCYQYYLEWFEAQKVKFSEDLASIRSITREIEELEGRLAMLKANREAYMMSAHRGHIPYAEIGRHAGMSGQKVRYTINRMKDEGAWA